MGTRHFCRFHWLPDELAYRYSARSDRENFNDLYRTGDPASMQHFLRRGRGMSFHELDLAIAPAGSLNVVSSLHSYLHSYQPNARSASSISQEFKSVLSRFYPGLHDGFFDEYLNLIIRR